MSLSFNIFKSLTRIKRTDNVKLLNLKTNLQENKKLFTFLVKSESNNKKYYTVRIDCQNINKNNKLTDKTQLKLDCTCPDFIYHCKAGLDGTDSLIEPLEEQYKNDKKVSNVSLRLCKHCYSALNYILKSGM